MTLPTLHAGVDFLPGSDSIRCDFGFLRHRDWFSRLLRLPARREVLDPGDQIHPLLSCERVPGWHDGTVQATRNGVVQVFIGGECSRRGGSAFEDGSGEIPRPWIDPLCGFSVTVS